MENKQIIIDKLKNDVACKENIINHLAEHNIKLQDQLKAKEQECAELKNIIDKAKNSKLDLKSFLVSEAIQNEYEQQLNQLKQILTEIKEVLQFYNNTTIGTYKGNGIFEFEVSNDNILGGKLIYCYDTNPAKKALQKISECEVE